MLFELEKCHHLADGLRGDIETGEGHPFSRGFSGERRDASGLVPYGFRTCAPTSARWLSPDPTRIAGAERHPLNFYQMVDGNPATYRDHQGLMKQGIVMRLDDPDNPYRFDASGNDARVFMRLLHDSRGAGHGAPELILSYLNARYTLEQGLFQTLLLGLMREAGMTGSQAHNSMVNVTLALTGSLRPYPNAVLREDPELLNRSGQSYSFSYYSEWLTQLFVRHAFRGFNDPVMDARWTTALLLPLYFHTHEPKFSSNDCLHIEHPDMARALGERERNLYLSFMQGFRPQILRLGPQARQEIFLAWADHIRANPVEYKTRPHPIDPDVGVTRISYPRGFRHPWSRGFGIDIALRSRSVFPDEPLSSNSESSLSSSSSKSSWQSAGDSEFWRIKIYHFGVRAEFDEGYRLQWSPRTSVRVQDLGRISRVLRKKLGRNYDPRGLYGIEETERTLMARVAYVMRNHSIIDPEWHFRISFHHRVRWPHFDTSSLLNRQAFFPRGSHRYFRLEFARFVLAIKLIQRRSDNSPVDKRITSHLDRTNDQFVREYGFGASANVIAELDRAARRSIKKSRFKKT